MLDARMLRCSIIAPLHPASHRIHASSILMLKPGQKIGKYKLKARLSNGPYATVFRAQDTLEGVHVALKIPHKGLVTKESLDDFSREVRLAAKLDASEYPGD